MFTLQHSRGSPSIIISPNYVRVHFPKAINLQSYNEIGKKFHELVHRSEKKLSSFFNSTDFNLLQLVWYGVRASDLLRNRTHSYEHELSDVSRILNKSEAKIDYRVKWKKKGKMHELFYFIRFEAQRRRLMSSRAQQQKEKLEHMLV